MAALFGIYRRAERSNTIKKNNTIPAVFNRAGYETFRTCKNGNSYSLANALFQMVKDKSCRNADEDSGSQWHGRQVLNYLEERSVRKEEKPFMIYFGFSHPHDARTGRDDLLAKYGARNVKKPLTEVNPDAPKLPVSWLPPMLLIANSASQAIP